MTATLPPPMPDSGNAAHAPPMPDEPLARWIARAAALERELERMRADADRWRHESLAMCRTERDRAAALERECEALRADMRLIADTDPVDAALDPQRAIRVARAALAARAQTTKEG